MTGFVNVVLTLEH